jgi:adenine-specific DNA-methyltransferase
MTRLIAENRILWPNSVDGRPRLKRFFNTLRFDVTGFSTFQDFGYTTDGTREIERIFGAKVFDFAKPLAALKELCKQGTAPNDGDVVLDFFGGSGTIGQAVIELNRADGGNRRAILVQIPEKISAGAFSTISQVGAERIRRVLTERKEGAIVAEHGGLRLFTLTASGFRNWNGVADKVSGALVAQIEAFADSLVPGWKPENVIWETALREGYSLTSRIEKISDGGKQSFWRVTDPDREQSFVIYLDDTLTLEGVRALKLKKDSLFICRDAALDDTLSANLALQCRLKVL